MTIQDGFSVVTTRIQTSESGVVMFDPGWHCMLVCLQVDRIQ